MLVMDKTEKFIETATMADFKKLSENNHPLLAISQDAGPGVQMWFREIIDKAPDVEFFRKELQQFFKKKSKHPCDLIVFNNDCLDEFMNVDILSKLDADAIMAIIELAGKMAVYGSRPIFEPPIGDYKYPTITWLANCKSTQDIENAFDKALFAYHDFQVEEGIEHGSIGASCEKNQDDSFTVTVRHVPETWIVCFELALKTYVPVVD